MIGPNIASSQNLKARERAEAVVSDLAVEPTALVQFSSQGRIVLITDDTTLGVGSWLTEKGLQVQVVQTSGESEPGYPCLYVGGRALSLTGHLGDFTLQVGEKGKVDHEQVKADLVLDLVSPSLFEMPLPPLGYQRASNQSELEILTAVEHLAQLKGSFTKPQFFSYDEGICAHARSGVKACRNCLDACPADAIISIGEAVEINANLCQGGGVCASVCPTGAIRYRYPSAEDTLTQIYRVLDVYAKEGGVDPVIAFVAEEEVPLVSPLSDNVMTLVVEELGSVGMEIWLMALIAGAKEIWMLDGGLMPARVATAMQQQLSVVAEILNAEGYSADSIRLCSVDDINLDADLAMADFKPVPHPNINGKRQSIYFALDKLYQQAPMPVDRIDLPAGAPFGRISVDAESCTLCMACTSVCPANAVQPGVEAPRLLFHEENCVQCGLCASACPEKVITLQPSITVNAEQRRQLTVLHEEAPFCCIICGTPFATHTMINNMVDKLSGHYMFQGHKAQRRLKMCEDCRVVDVVQDEDMMSLEGLRH